LQDFLSRNEIPTYELLKKSLTKQEFSNTLYSQGFVLLIIKIGHKLC